MDVSIGGGTAAPREGSAQKRAAILQSARELFVTNGVARTSMDAVAARAPASKRTVYDYFGNKHQLLLGVIENAGNTALHTLQTVIDAHLPGDGSFATPSDMERALEEFAVELGRALFASSEYVAAVQLIRENESELPELDGHPLDAAHAKVLTDRLAELAARRLLDIDDPALASEHFSALTISRVLAGPSSYQANSDHVARIARDGAKVFFRAYGFRK